MTWNTQQDAALMAAKRWLSSDEQVFRLFGYAGTGKTTLARHLVESFGGKVAFAAFTNRAAAMLGRAGCPNPTTLHKLLYVPSSQGTSSAELVQKINERVNFLHSHDRPESGDKELDLLRKKYKEQLRNSSLRFRLNEEAPINHYDLVVVDESSFVDVPTGEDLESFGKKLLVLGDPGQLPPVKGFGYFINDRPDVMLTEVERFDHDSGIMRLATIARKRGNIQPGKYGNCTVLQRKDLSVSDGLKYDQILCGTNKTRIKGNNTLRSALGYGGSKLPVVGDKLVARKTMREYEIFNGNDYTVTDAPVADCVSPGNTEVYLSMSNSEQVLENLPVDTLPFLTETEQPYWENVCKFDYGYIRTVHTAQGGQWGRVLVIDESGVFRQDRFKHLYTAITRATDVVDIAI